MKYINSTLLVQLVERRFPKPDVVGSSPTGRVKNKKVIGVKNYCNRCC